MKSISLFGDDRVQAYLKADNTLSSKVIDLESAADRILAGPPNKFDEALSTFRARVRTETNPGLQEIIEIAAGLLRAAHAEGGGSEAPEAKFDLSAMRELYGRVSERDFVPQMFRCLSLGDRKRFFLELGFIRDRATFAACLESEAAVHLSLSYEDVRQLLVTGIVSNRAHAERLLGLVSDAVEAAKARELLDARAPFDEESAA